MSFLKSLAKLLVFGKNANSMIGNKLIDVFGNHIESVVNQTTGAGLTGAAREGNQFTHDERIETQDWQEHMRNTELQSRVADARAAGINPMMAVGSGSSTPGGSAGSSVAPSAPGGSLSDLMQLYMLPAQKKVLQAQAKNLEAGAAEREAKVPFWEMSVEKAQAQLQLYLQQAKTEEAKRGFYLDRAFLARCQGENIVFLQQSIKDLNDAQSEQAKAAAAANMVHAAYEKGLIDAGYIEKLVAKAVAETAAARGAAKASREQAKLYDKQTELTSEEILKVANEAGLALSKDELVKVQTALENGTFVKTYLQGNDNVHWVEFASRIAKLMLGPLAGTGLAGAVATAVK